MPCQNAKTQPPAFKSHFRPGRAPDVQFSLSFKRERSPEKRFPFFPGKAEALHRTRGTETIPACPANPHNFSPAPPFFCKNNKQLRAEHIMQHFGRPSFPTSANCCSPRKKAEGGIKEGEAKKEKCQGRRTPLHVRSLGGEDYLVLCQLCPGFLFPPCL